MGQKVQSPALWGWRRKWGISVAITAALATACGGGTRSCGAPGASGAAAPLASVRLVGRFDPPSGPNGSVRFAWSGSSFEVRFTGPSIAMRLRTSLRDVTPYTVTLDDRPPTTLDVSSDRERYDLASGLDPATPHFVRVTREVEAFAGVHELLGVELGPGGRLLPPRAAPLRIDVVGDSITCGYGVLGDSERCKFSFATERASAAYGARLGKALDADVTTVCWSGRGVLRNYDGSTTGTMPELYELAIPEGPPTPWSFASSPRADAVVVGLGTNDFLGGGGRPLDLDAFEEAFVRFLGRVREHEPSAFVFVTTSPMLTAEPMQELARARLARVVARRSEAGDRRIELVVLDGDAAAGNHGCDAHPNAADDARIAARLEQVIRARLRR